MKKIECGIDDFKKFVADKRVFVFGAGIQGQRWIKIFEDWGMSCRIQALIDNGKWGGTIQGFLREYEIISMDEACNALVQNDFILISSIHYLEIEKQILQFLDGKDIFYTSTTDISREQLVVSDYEGVVRESESQLIPKKIHYAWFGGEMPDKMKRNIESWHRFCPDYEIKKWSDDNYDVTKNTYMHQAYQNKVWGFVPDYLRLDVILNEGGVYFDTDVELVDNIDDMLYQKCFGVSDCSFAMNLGSGFGAQPGCDIIRELRDYYDNQVFEFSDGSLNKVSCNTHHYNVMRRYGFNVNDCLQKCGDMNVYPMIISGACSFARKTRVVPGKTKWIHYGEVSWMENSLGDYEN